MKHKFIIHLLGLLLFSGCVVADDFLRQVRLAEKAVKTAQNARRSAKAVEEAEKALQATQRAKEAHRRLIQSAPAAQQSDEIARALQQVQKMEYKAQFMKLEAQAESAIAATTNNIKTGGGELANVSDPDLAAFLRDLLCLHFEKITKERKLPSDEDYQKFLQDYAITRVIPVWEIKEKAKSIIDFAESKPSFRCRAAGTYEYFAGMHSSQWQVNPITEFKNKWAMEEKGTQDRVSSPAKATPAL